MCACMCTWANVFWYLCLCCFALVQKGLVPTTWCRAASAPPIPAWIATLAANQKLPAAFAVCPLSIFSNASLNPLVSLGCCINPTPPRHPHPTMPPLRFNTLPYHEFLMSVFWQALSSIPSHRLMRSSQTQTNGQQSGFFVSEGHGSPVPSSRLKRLFDLGVNAQVVAIQPTYPCTKTLKIRQTNSFTSFC